MFGFGKKKSVIATEDESLNLMTMGNFMGAADKIKRNANKLDLDSWGLCVYQHFQENEESLRAQLPELLPLLDGNPKILFTIAGNLYRQFDNFKESIEEKDFELAILFNPVDSFMLIEQTPYFDKNTILRVFDSIFMMVGTLYANKMIKAPEEHKRKALLTLIQKFIEETKSILKLANEARSIHAAEFGKKNESSPFGTHDEDKIKSVNGFLHRFKEKMDGSEDTKIEAFMLESVMTNQGQYSDDSINLAASLMELFYLFQIQQIPKLEHFKTEIDRLKDIVQNRPGARELDWFGYVVTQFVADGTVKYLIHTQEIPESRHQELFDMMEKYSELWQPNASFDDVEALMRGHEAFATLFKNSEEAPGNDKDLIDELLEMMDGFDDKPVVKGTQQSTVEIFPWYQDSGIEMDSGVTEMKEYSEHVYTSFLKADEPLISQISQAYSDDSDFANYIDTDFGQAMIYSFVGVALAEDPDISENIINGIATVLNWVQKETDRIGKGKYLLVLFHIVENVNSGDEIRKEHKEHMLNMLKIFTNCVDGWVAK